LLLLDLNWLILFQIITCRLLIQAFRELEVEKQEAEERGESFPLDPVIPDHYILKEPIIKAFNKPRKVKHDRLRADELYD